MKSDNSRFLAYQVLQKYFPERTNVSQLLNDFLAGYPDLKDKGFVREMVWGVVRYLNSIDFIIDSVLEKKKVINSVRNILRLGAYQLLFVPERFPVYAAINETVELARLSDQENCVSLVNALLRRMDREKDAMPYPEREKDLVKYLAIRYSHPEWMVSRWVKMLGESSAEALLLSNNTYPGLTVRTNTLKITREALKQKLEGEGIKSEFTRHSPDGLIFAERPELESSESFAKGLFIIQDEASQLIAYMLEPKPGEKILDLCSGVGIKSSHLAQLAKREYEIISVDNSPRQIDIAKRNLEKLGVSGVSFNTEDAKKLRGIEADKVLLDAPCSGLGAIRRKPDIKWNHNLKMVQSYYPALQRELLESAARALKVGGTLVYSTCTTEPEENEEVIHGFLKKFKNFAAEKPPLVPVFEGLIDDTGYFLRTYPYKHNMDGFFAARLRRLS